MKKVILNGRKIAIVGGPEPVAPDGWARISLRLAGICGTDIELSRGYKEFSGTLGHEFVGTVVQSSNPALHNKRVVGEINVGCGSCDTCRAGIRNHCPSRRILGMCGLDGCFSESFLLPELNLHVVPDDLPDEKAVFVEPLAAAFRVLEQVSVSPETICVVIGAGKLGILCSWVLSTVSRHVLLTGRSGRNFPCATWNGILTARVGEGEIPAADLVVDCSGSPDGLKTALDIVRPRGTIVLKSTFAGDSGTNPSLATVKEISVKGSRCGPFPVALAAAPGFPLERLIEAVFPLENASEAFARATNPGSLKVLLKGECPGSGLPWLSDSAS